MRRYASVLALIAGIIVAIIFARTTHLKEWSWIGGLVLGIAVAAILSRVLYGYRDARTLDVSKPEPGSYASRSIIQNITGAPTEPSPEDEEERERNDRDEERPG